MSLHGRSTVAMPDAQPATSTGSTATAIGVSLPKHMPQATLPLSPNGVGYQAIEARVVELIYVTVFTTPTHPLHDSHQPLLGLMQLPCCIGVHFALLSSDLINVVKYIMRW